MVVVVLTLPFDSDTLTVWLMGRPLLVLYCVLGVIALPVICAEVGYFRAKLTAVVVALHTDSLIT